MARKRSPERDKARELWLASGGNMTAKELSEQTGAKPEQIRKWKSLDKWEAQKPKRKRGAQPGNKNALGAGAPFGNLNAQTHGAYTAVRLESLTPEQRDYIANLTLDTKINMQTELQLLIAKEADLQNKVSQLERDETDALFIDKVVEMRIPRGEERLKTYREKLDKLIRERDNLTWELDREKPVTKNQEKKLDRLHHEIAELEDRIGDAENDRENSADKINMKTVIKASAFQRRMILESEINKIHGRIIKLLDSIKTYELETRRAQLEVRKYNLAKQRLSGVYEIDPNTGEIDDESGNLDSEYEL